MVTLRSEGKQASAMAQPIASQSKSVVTAGRTARRSATPDTASQDSGLRRSQRVRDRHGALESIQEDTAASAEAATEENGTELAKQCAAEAVSEPVLTRAQAVQQAILQASDSIAGGMPLHDAAQEVDQLSPEDSDSETNDELLATLSRSMFAALRPKATNQDAGNRANENGTAATDSLSAFQPDAVQANRQQTTQDEHEEDEMHWQPLTGLPEPLTATDCRSHTAATRPSQLEKQFKLAPRDTRSLDRQAAKLAPKTAGKQWFDLPAQQMTDETKRDLKLLQLRGTFDPKRFYKSSDHKKGLPKFFQVGTVVSSSADFYSGRLSNKERKRTITEELLADPELSQARKRRFNKLQDERAYWASKRGRKTDLPRGKKVSRSKK